MLLPQFAGTLGAVERSGRLATRVLDKLKLPPAAVLRLTYERLQHEHAESMRLIAEFLRLPAQRASDGSAAAAVPAAVPYRKSTPDRLCVAVRNYAELCAAYASSKWARWLELPCDAACDAR